MATHSAQRRLVKSRPELWAEISDQQSLARRLEAFGEIRITGTDPETTVAWEGTAASGTVEIESAGWGTKVILTVELADPPAVAEPKPEPVAVKVAPAPKPEPEPVAMQAPTPKPKPEPVAMQAPTPKPEPAAAAPKKGLFARLFGFGPPIPDPPRTETTTESVAAPAPAPTPVPTAEPEPAPAPPPAALTPPEVEPTVIAEPAGATMPDGQSVDDFLSAVLDDLGAAHHRPFSRS